MSTCERKVPQDRYHIAYQIFYLLGCTTLLPWNFFITANAYFSAKLKNKPNLESTFQNYFSVGSMGPNMFIMILNVFLFHKCSRFVRMVVSIFMLLVSFTVTASFVLVNTSTWTEEFFIATMIILVLISGFGAMLQGALFGLAGMMPPRYIQAVMAGQGLGGFFVCIVSILSSVGGSKITDSSFGYFCTGIFAMIISLLAYVYLERLPIVKYYTNITKGVCFCTCECENECHLNSTITNKEDTKEDDKQEKEGEATNNNNKDINYLRIIKKIKCMMLTVYITFLVTLSVFPSLTARIESTWTDQNKWTESLFVLVGCFLTYNLFDYIGKSAVSFFQKPTNERPWLLVVLAALRVLFIPLFLFCNVQPRISNIPVAFSHDSLPIIFMALFAFTGGYLGSLPFIYGPSMVEPHEQEITATLIVFSLVAGLTSGAALSFAIAPNV